MFWKGPLPTKAMQRAIFCVRFLEKVSPLNVQKGLVIMCQILPIIEHEAKMTWLQHQQQAAAAVSDFSLKLPFWHLFNKLLTNFGLKSNTSTNLFE